MPKKRIYAFISYDDVTAIKNKLSSLQDRYNLVLNIFSDQTLENGVNQVLVDGADILIIDTEINNISGKNVIQLLDSNPRITENLDKFILISNTNTPDISLRNKAIVFNKNNDGYLDHLYLSVNMAFDQKVEIINYSKSDDQEKISFIDAWAYNESQLKNDLKNTTNLFMQLNLMLTIVISNFFSMIFNFIKENRSQKLHIQEKQTMKSIRPSQQDRELEFFGQLALGLTVILIAAVTTIFNSDININPNLETSDVLGVNNSDTLVAQTYNSVAMITDNSSEQESIEANLEIIPIENNRVHPISKLSITYEINSNSDYFYFYEYSSNDVNNISSEKVITDVNLFKDNLSVNVDTTSVQIKGRLLAKLCIENRCINKIVNERGDLNFAYELDRKENNILFVNEPVNIVNTDEQEESLISSYFIRTLEGSTILVPFILLFGIPLSLIAIGSPIKDVPKYFYKLITGDVPKRNSFYSGIIFDGDNSKPIPFSKIELLDKEGTKLISTSSDDAGRFLFKDITPGQYILKSKINGFHNYHKKIHISSDRKVHSSIEMERLNKKFGIIEEIIFFQKVSIINILRYMLGIMIIIGLIINIAALVASANIMVIITLSIYIIFSIIIFLSFIDDYVSGDHGEILDKETNNPISNAIVRIFNSKDELVEMMLTDEIGSLNFNLPVGNYTFKISKSGYINVTFSQKLEDKGDFKRQILLLRN